jgi:hypothetical protein
MAWTGLGARTRRHVFTASAAGIVILAGAATGFGVVAEPLFAWALVGIVVAVLLMLSPPHVRIAAVVITATCSRLAVATGYISSFANFVHYPLVLVVALLAAAESPAGAPGRRPLELGVLSLLAVALVSWLINGGDLLRPFLDWLVFAEPLLVIYAIMLMPQVPARAGFLWALALGLLFAQLPLAVYQGTRFGFSDPVQGIFIGLGSGAHVAGAVSLVGSLACTARGLSKRKPAAVVAWLTGAVALFSVAYIADAKQVIMAWIPALLLLLAASTRQRATWVLAGLPILVVVLLAFLEPPSALQRAFDWNLISQGAAGKLNAFSVIAERLSSSWVEWLIGLGPGNSVSRVATMGLDAFVKHDSPVYLLGLGPAATTVELWNLTASNPLYASSSVWSFVSSWLGLLGDLGLAGMAAYLASVAAVWARLRGRVGWEPAAARSAQQMMILLAFLYSWLEEPGYTVMAALVIGLGCLSAVRGPAVASHSRGAAPPGGEA